MRLSLFNWCLKNNCSYILEQWDLNKNLPLTFKTVSYGSEKEVFWHCNQCGYSWTRKICNTTSGKRGCPKCAKKRWAEKTRKTKIGKTGSFAIVYPNLLKYWDYSKNIVSPHEISPKSNLKVWWKCKHCKKLYYAKVSSRVIGHGFCSNCRAHKRIQTLISKNGCLFEKTPELLQEYMLDRNKVAPNSITPSSNKKYWWKCKKCGHEWQAPASSRRKGHGCPACSGRIPTKNNNLATMAPQLAQEWHPTKNGSLKPEDIAPYSCKKVWWKCKRGHEWQATVSNRYQGRNCKQCSNELRTSFPEQSIVFYLSQKFNIQSRSKINGWEIDILLPDYDIGIEYDGIAYHDRLALEDREKCKNDAFKEVGLDLIRVKESYEHSGIIGDTVYFIVDHKYNNLEHALSDLLRVISKKTCISTEDIKIDLEEDRIEIYNNYIGYIKEHSFAEKFPNLLYLWGYEENGELRPDMVTPYSNKKVWWHCPICNGKWLESIINVAKGNRCPFCSGHRVLAGFNDLQTLFPKIAKQWDYEKNIGITPDMVTAGSNKLIHWKCLNGHEWSNTVSYQTKHPDCKVCWA